MKSYTLLNAAFEDFHFGFGYIFRKIRAVGVIYGWAQKFNVVITASCYINKPASIKQSKKVLHTDF